MSLTRLRLHDVLEHSGRLWRVDLVNDCRARLLPIVKRTREITPKTGQNADKTVTFTCSDNHINIDPNADLPVVGRFDVRTDRIRFYGQEPSSAPLPESTETKPEINHDDSVQQMLL